jgi:predicted AAA+ superfamily ATPase
LITFAIEIKSSSATEQKLSANTRKYLSLRNDENAKGAIFYLGDITCDINNISYVSWKDWCNFSEE